VTGKVVPLTYRAIWLILDRNEALRALSALEIVDPVDSVDCPNTPTVTSFEAALPPSIVLALESALHVSLIGEDHYRVVLTPEEAKNLASWCREVAAGSSRPTDSEVLRLVAAVIDLAP